MYAEIIILGILQGRPQHGYEIKKSIDLILGGSVSMNNKVLYPTLKRFEEMGAVLREVERQEGKPDRHVYQLTDRGNELLQAFLRDFTPAIANNDSEFFTRVAFFSLLELEVRVEILTTRAEVIAKKLAHLQKMEELAAADAMVFARHVLALHQQQARLELDWIAGLLEETKALIGR